MINLKSMLLFSVREYERAINSFIESGTIYKFEPYKGKSYYNALVTCSYIDLEHGNEILKNDIYPSNFNTFDYLDQHHIMSIDKVPKKRKNS